MPSRAATESNFDPPGPSSGAPSGASSGLPLGRAADRPAATTPEPAEPRPRGARAADPLRRDRGTGPRRIDGDRTPPSILVVEDQPALARMIERVLREEGFDAEAVFDGPHGLEAVERRRRDLVILDVMLPGIDGLTVCRTLRERGHVMPVVMLTARDAVADRVRGLDAGADDYLVKPFAFEELLARIRAQLRREAGAPGASDGVLTVADLRLDPGSHAVTRAGRPIELTALEFRLLEFMMRHTGQVLTRDAIVEHVWGYDAVHTSKPVDLYVHYLRKKVDVAPAKPLLHTVRSVGYVLHT